MRNFFCYVLLGALLVVPLSAASVDGLKLHSSSTGRGSKTVIFVHGWTCDETSWTAQVPALSKQYRVVTLDLPGHGKSDSPKDGKFSMDLFARAVEAVRAEAKADKVVLAGHSMGTPVIRQYARLYPQHVAGLVLVDGLMSPTPTGAGRGGAPQAARMGGPAGLQARENMIRGMFTPATPPAVQDQVLKMMLAPPEATATGAMTATFEATFSDEAVNVPALGLYADKSRLVNREYVKKVFPSFEYVEIPGTGHFLMMEKPEEFNKLLTGFLDKVKY